MFIYIRQLLSKVFAHTGYQSQLDRYVASKHPKDVYDVERLTREFDQKLQKGMI